MQEIYGLLDTVVFGKIDGGEASKSPEEEVSESRKLAHHFKITPYLNNQK